MRIEGQYDKHKWIKKETTGQAPCPRYLHSSVIVDSVLYVFGGLDSNNKFLNDLYAFDISTSKELTHSFVEHRISISFFSEQTVQLGTKLQFLKIKAYHRVQVIPVLFILWMEIVQ
jgi:N-acetylneuraminic acid mutarotase